jgi:hypothetical protein
LELLDVLIVFVSLFVKILNVIQDIIVKIKSAFLFQDIALLKNNVMVIKFVI